MRKFTLSRFLVTLFVALLINSVVNAADVECTRDTHRGRKYLRPTSPIALGIAKKHGVVTCEGRKFNEDVIANKLTTNYKLKSGGKSLDQIIKENRKK